MNVLHINQSDLSGGAAIAGYRLHQGLLAQGVDSHLLVGNAQSNSDRVTTTPAKKTYIERQLYLRLTKPLGLNYLHFLNTFNIPKKSVYKNADILNFHNLHTGYFNYLAVSSLTKDKPAVFTLHDMWSFTGHCTYSYDCDRWKTGCGKCPYPDVYPQIEKDNTRLEWRLKNWIYSQSNLTVATPSRWLYEQAKQSILNRFPIHHIPYGIDTQAYQPLDPEQCRAHLGIPRGKKVLMFGADSLTERRKGGDLLAQALQNLPSGLKAETMLLIFGNSGAAIAQTVGMTTIDLGYLTSDESKTIAYSAADLFVFPTRADNLPLTLQESIACGTPMISCKIGGVPDLVRPGITGYLAKPENAQDLCDGIVYLLEEQNLREQMRHNCRAIALSEYPLELQAKRYLELYNQLVKNT
ncbi:glycosyltransferase family 4 protein [Gloeocapsopsis sp. IPPAS B-1203]|uniref:glycosyltransferase family 4 protein n=1 Tax=Gloeocapsopsis sp. IPPAS B-1203 TaxID=2049454 RepID=UPI000C18E376|nr:glycosyltransferase family 4 protein [Gloeocapsopsis sp. IPPAS B-1203]PIG93294.1 glycosyl transferase [Gloeocapsopsis sp. IPPAS B-1203]